MFKRVIAIVLIISIIPCMVLSAIAHDNQDEHDSDLKSALFGNRDKFFGSRAERDAFQAIANAAAITIDQFTPNVSKQWKKGVYDNIQKELSSLGLPKLSIPFEKLDLNANISEDGENVTANKHRKYTHMGWNYSKYPNMAFWKLRKQVMLDVVNRVLFNSNTPFSGIPWISDILYAPNEQCNAFCAMVYYIHILGDHIEGDSPDKLTDLEPLIQYKSLSVPGIIVELKEYLQVVFASQRSSWSFILLEQQLTELSITAEKECGTWYAIDSIDKCVKNQFFAKELLRILSAHLPGLLARESFFSKRFKTQF